MPAPSQTNPSSGFERRIQLIAVGIALALCLLDLYATTIGLGVCWGGYLYGAANADAAVFEALGLPAGHRAFGAVMLGYPKFKYQRIPVRNEPRVTWK